VGDLLLSVNRPDEVIMTNRNVRGTGLDGCDFRLRPCYSLGASRIVSVYENMEEIMAEIHWLNSVDGDFLTASNWSGGVVPGRSDDAFIDAIGASPYTVTLSNTQEQVVNSLQISSTATLDIVNSGIGIISGGNNAGKLILDQNSIFNATGSSKFLNSGVILAEEGGFLLLSHTVVNSGTISLADRKSNLYCGYQFSLSGGGMVEMSGSSILGGTDGGVETLTNVDNAIEGVGRIAGWLAFTNEAGGVVDADQKGSLILSVHNLTLANAGLIEATNHGVCVIKSAIDNTGMLEADGGVLRLEAAVTGSGVVDLAAGRIEIENAHAAEAIAFTGKKGALELTQSQSFTGAVSGFSKNGKTSLDLRDISFVSPAQATFSGTATSGVLTVTDGTHTAEVTLEGNYRSVTFTASDDGFGGVEIVAAKAPRARVVHFASAMAAMSGDAPGVHSPAFAGPSPAQHRLALVAPPLAMA
jgi:hypothetical protein